MTHRMRCSNSGPLRATNWAVLSTMLLMSGGGCSTPLTVAGAPDGVTVCAVCPGTNASDMRRRSARQSPGADRQRRLREYVANIAGLVGLWLVWFHPITPLACVVWVIACAGVYGARSNGLTHEPEWNLFYCSTMCYMPRPSGVSLYLLP